MKYLRIMPDIFFESTEKNGCFYHLLEQKVQYFPNEENEILKSLLIDNISIEDVTLKNGNADSLIQKLCAEGDAYIFDSPVFCEDAIIKSEVENRGYLEPVPRFKNLYIEISDKCNFKCDNCNSTYTNHPCYSCFPWLSDTNTKMNDEAFRYAISQLKHLKISNVIFSGGEPLINFARIQLAIEEFTNSNEIPTFWIKSPLSCELTYEEYLYLGDNGIGIDIVKNTENTKQENIIQNVIAKLEEAGVPYRFSCISTNESKNVEEELCAEIKINNNRLRTINDINELKDSFPVDFSERKKFNECFSSNIALEKSGMLKPCPHMSFSYGSFESENINEMFRKLENDRFLRLTKQLVASCKNCSLRYACNSDCTKYNMQIKGECGIVS